MPCIWLTKSYFPSVLFRGGAKRRSQPSRRSRSILELSCAHVSEFDKRTACCGCDFEIFGSDDERTACCGFDFEIFGTADTSEIFCWPKNVDAPERGISVSGFDKGHGRPAASTLCHLTHRSQRWSRSCDGQCSERGWRTAQSQRERDHIYSAENKRFADCINNWRKSAP